MVSPRPDASPAGTTSADWTVQVADTIESVVGSVRDKTAVPLETVARALVYGILIAVVGVTALVLGVILLIRVLTYTRLEVYAIYGILGAIFTLLGMFLWRKRRPAGDPSKK
jgi:membrane associated rhomboid family serine protease